MNRVHIALKTNNFEKSVEFYRHFFANAPEKKTTSYAKFTSKLVPINLTLNATDDPIEGNQLSHLGVEVFDREAVDKHITRLSALKLDLLEEKNTDCCYANQDKVWVQDPDGNAWEIFFVKEQLALPEESEEEACCA